MGYARNISLGLLAPLAVVFTAGMPAVAQQPQKPNILVIMADDIGYSNISAYNRGMMGYHTPNIDRIANEGSIFTDYYGQQSCTAGRAAFITGQSPLRTGLLKVGLPAAKEGLPHSPSKINKINDLVLARLPHVYQCCAPKSSRLPAMAITTRPPSAPLSWPCFSPRAFATAV